MQRKDIHKPVGGLNTDDDPSILPPEDYTDALNMRITSSSEQHGVGVAETLQSEIEVLLDTAMGCLYYYGSAIGGQFVYEGYEEVQIGTQVWMKRNWDVNFPGSKVYDNDEDNREVYGGLYNWYQINQDNFVPDGWHVPTEAEINTLLTYIGGILIGGGKLKEFGLDHWLTPNTDGGDNFGFKALPGGKYDSVFSLLTEAGLFWLADGYNSAPLVDKDGNEYTTVIIGTQEWIVENFKSTKYADGSAIPNITDQTDWANDVIGAYCYYNNDEATYKNDYGALYNWYAVNNIAGLAYLEKGGVQETGWRVPTKADTDILVAFLGGAAVAGGHLKEIGTTHWLTPNDSADNSSGFTHLPGGNRDTTSFGYIGEGGYILTSTEVNALQVYAITSSYDQGSMNDAWTPSKEFGISVRLVRDVAFNDWFLPSIEELQKIQLDIAGESVGNFITTPGSYYASSTEIDSTTAYQQGMDSDVNTYSYLKSDGSQLVRAVRSFTSTDVYSLRDIGPAGGWIFEKIDNGDGTYLYYETAPADQSGGMAWSNIINVEIGITAQGSAIGTGKANTLAIIGQVGHTNSAAKVCDDLIV
jgi:uncharacterized protein (TIGR02145 family)